MQLSPPLALVTGASSGIGLELARECARNGYDLVIVADDPHIDEVAAGLRRLGREVRAVRCDLATPQGVRCAGEAAEGRPIDALLANAGHGLGCGFLDQPFEQLRHVIDTNVTGTLALVHAVGGQMRDRGMGRILVTGSLAGYTPGTYQAVYNGTKALINSFTIALRHELKDSGVSVTCLMPGPTRTQFFERAHMTDTKLGQEEKADPASVARDGFAAMMRGDSHVISGFRNKVQALVSHVIPMDLLAEQHTRQARPGTALRTV
jgi:short-subunit dehydrogenase